MPFAPSWTAPSISIPHFAIISILIPRRIQSTEELTNRDKAVWNAVVEGLTNKEIASRVHISEALVKVTLQHLFDKHGVRTRSQLVRIALEQQSLRS